MRTMIIGLLFATITVTNTPAVVGPKLNFGGNSQTCTLNGLSPSQCSVTVTAGAFCGCTPVGSTSAIAAGGCAVSLASTTLTATGPNGGNWPVNIICDR